MEPSYVGDGNASGIICSDAPGIVPLAVLGMGFFADFIHSLREHTWKVNISSKVKHSLPDIDARSTVK